MAIEEHVHARSARVGIIRAPQSFASGLGLIVLAGLAIFFISDLNQGTLRAIGPAMLPRWLAIAIGLCGLGLLGSSFLRDGEPLEAWRLRGPIFVTIGIVAFALTIRLFGLAVAGPLALIIGGLGSDETRPKELIIFAILMSAFCIGLFRYVLNQPMPVLIIPGTNIYV